MKTPLKTMSDVRLWPSTVRAMGWGASPPPDPGDLGSQQERRAAEMLAKPLEVGVEPPEPPRPCS